MSKTTPNTRAKISVDDTEPIVIDMTGRADDVYRSLANERRRRILSVLSNEAAPIGVKSLARSVAEQEGDLYGTTSEETVEKVYVSIYHCHLPKLSRTDLVAYDTEAETVEGTFEISDTVGT